VPKLITHYRAFIGSPGGLDEEREYFRRKLETYTAVHGEPRDIAFYPVGWEDTVGGVGRPTHRFATCASLHASESERRRVQERLM
jgi:hypothetical protein